MLLLGFVVIAIAAAALVAPFFVDWNTYRAEFEDYGRKVTGRDVTIAGPIEARLFPWPALVLNQVTVANGEGTRRANLMEARRIDIGMSLAPMISGQVEVDTVTIDGPVFAFERLASGAASWTIEPDRSLPALIDPDRVQVSQISITDGTVYAGDHRRDDLTRIDALVGTLTAPSLSGPWRMRATAAHDGSPFEINLSTGRLVPGEATRVGLRLSPVDDAGVIYSFDGEVGRPEGRGLKGAIKVMPTASERGKSNAETGLPRFEVKADIEADFDAVSLTGIEASPAFSTDPGNFITGSAHIGLGRRIAVDAALSAARIDLDQIAGRRGRDLMQSEGAFENLALFLARTPEALDLRVDLSAASVIVGGETLDASRLSFALDRERLRIEEFTTAMPGQTRTRFSGLFMFDQGEPLMSGDISVESASLRDFVQWALPHRQRTIAEVWSGSRGRATLDAKLDVSAHGVRLSEVDAMLDEAHVTGSLTSRAGPDHGLAVRIDADRLDLDRYLPRGFGDWAGDRFGQSGIAMALVDGLSRTMTFGDFQLTAQAGQLRFHGVEAHDIAIDLGANDKVVELRTVEIGQVGAARLGLVGLLSFPEEGIAGSVNGHVDAEDPRALLRLLGAFGLDQTVEPAWAAAVGPLDVTLMAEASAEDGMTNASMALTGTAGGASAALQGTFRGEPAGWKDAEIELSGEMDARSSALLAALTGLDLYERSDRPTKLAGSLAGSLSEGVATTLEAELFGARGQFTGTIEDGRRNIEAHGRLAVLAEDAAELFAIVGVPPDRLDQTGRVLAAETEVTLDGRGLRLPSLSGTAGGAAFNGNLTLVAEPVRRVTGNIAAERLSLPWLLGAILLPRDGKPHALSSHFAVTVPAMEANVTISADRLDLLPQVALDSSQLKLTIGRYGLALEASGSGPGGEPATGHIDVDLDSRGITVEGAVAGPVDLGGLLRAGDGRQVIEADARVDLAFSSNGRSPAGVLAALQADGTYELTRGVLKRVDPETFARDLAAAKQPSEIDPLFDVSLRSGDMTFAGGSGSLTMADGVLQAAPLDIRGQGISGQARFVMEAASGAVDLSFILNLAGLRDIPSFEVAYAGPPRSLEASTEAQGLRSFLSMRMLQDSVQQLEELQRQELELIEEEEEFQRQQAERERQRQAQQRREAQQRELADRQLDRMQRELAERLKAEQREVEEREAEERQAEEPRPEDRKADREVEEVQPFVEPESIEEAVPAGESEPEPEPASAPSGAVTVAPLDVPGPRQEATDALSEPALVPVPTPRLKPQRDAARQDAVAEPVQRPPDGNLGRIPTPVFTGPTILQPDLRQPHSDMGQR